MHSFCNYTWKRKTEIYLSNGDYTSAQNAIENIAELNEEDADYKLLYSTLAAIYTDERTVKEITEEEEASIRAIGGKYTPSGIKALNILKYAFNEPHEELFDEVDEFYYRQMYEVIQQENSMFKLYPVTADEVIYIELLNTDLTCNHLLNVYDITGKKFRSEQLRNEYKVSWINIEDLTPGIYFFEVICSEQTVDTQKLVIE